MEICSRISCGKAAIKFMLPFVISFAQRATELLPNFVYKEVLATSFPPFLTFVLHHRKVPFSSLKFARVSHYPSSYTQYTKSPCAFPPLPSPFWRTFPISLPLLQWTAPPLRPAASNAPTTPARLPAGKHPLTQHLYLPVLFLQTLTSLTA